MIDFIGQIDGFFVPFTGLCHSAQVTGSASHVDVARYKTRFKIVFRGAKDGNCFLNVRDGVIVFSFLTKS